MTPSVGTLAAAILDRYPIEASLDLGIGGSTLRLRTNSSELRDRLADYFRYWVTTTSEPEVEIVALEAKEPVLPVHFFDWIRDPGKTGRKDEYADIIGGRAVRKVRTGMQYLLGEDLRLVFGPCIQNDNQVVNFVVAQYINLVLNRGRVLCHSAAVTRRSSGLAISGISGAGKSTLALHLMQEGLDFVSNDRLLVGSHDGRPWLWGVPKQPRINPGTALNVEALSSIVSAERKKQLAALDRDALWELEEKHDVDIGRVYGKDRWRADAALDAFLVLRWNRASSEPTRFRRVEPSRLNDVLGPIMKPPGPFYQPPSGVPDGIHRQTEDEYRRELERVAIYEATGRVDFDLAVKKCLEELLA